MNALGLVCDLVFNALKYMGIVLCFLWALLLACGCSAIAEHHEGIEWYQPKPSSQEFIQVDVTVSFVDWHELQKVCLEYDAQAVACTSGKTIYLPERKNLTGSHVRALHVQFGDWEPPYMVGDVLHVYDPVNPFDQCESGRLLAARWGFDMGRNDFCALGAEAVFHVAAGREDPPGGHYFWSPHP